MTENNLPVVNHHFPAQIQDYHFVSVIGGVAAKSRYGLGLYRNAEGKEAVCKVWTGTTHNQHYTWIKNEITNYQILNQVSVSQESLAPYSVNIPQLLTYAETENEVYFLVEKIDGTLLSESPSRLAVTSIEILLYYFNLLSQQIDLDHISIVKRSNAMYLALLSAYSLKAIIGQPSLIGTICSNYLFVISHLPKFLTDKKQIFVHRDLGGYNNVYLDNKVINVIDFQISAISHPLVEVANIIATKWENTEFIQQFIESQTVTEILKDQNSRRILQIFIIYGAIFDLASGSGRSTKDSLAQLAFARTL